MAVVINRFHNLVVNGAESPSDSLGLNCGLEKYIYEDYGSWRSVADEPMMYR